MLTLNLEALGVTPDALKEQILSQLGLTPEEAVIALAKELGIECINADDYNPEPAPAPVTQIRTGDVVETDRGSAEAIVMEEGDLRSIKGAINTLYGRFCA